MTGRPARTAVLTRPPSPRRAAAPSPGRRVAAAEGLPRQSVAAVRAARHRTDGRHGAADGVGRWLRGLVPEAGAARQLGTLELVQATGNGVFLTSSAIFFATYAGLTASEVGLGLSVAGLAGLVAAVPAGRLADRVGAGNALVANFAALAVLFCAYCFVDGPAAFTVTAALISVCESANRPLQASLTFDLFGAADRVRVSAQLRGLFNVGFLGGAAVAGAALAVGSREMFYLVMAGNAAAQLCCVAVVARLRAAARAGPRDRPTGPEPVDAATAAGGRAPRRAGPAALANPTFLAVALVCGALELYQTVLTAGLPLWIVARTEAPASMAAAVLLVNTVLVFGCQAAMSRGAGTLDGAARLLRRSGLLQAAACLVFAAAAGADAVLAGAVLAGGAVLMTFGELGQAAGSFGVVFALAPTGRQAEYQAAFSLGRGVRQAAGPLLVVWLVVAGGVAGWAALAAVFLAVGALSVPAVRAARRVPGMSGGQADGTDADGRSGDGGDGPPAGDAGHRRSGRHRPGRPAVPAAHCHRARCGRCGRA